MSAPTNTGQQVSAALPLALLNLKDIAKLTDAAQELFITLHALERGCKRSANARLAEVFAKLDLFGPSGHYTDHEEYEPEKRGQP